MRLNTTVKRFHYLLQLYANFFSYFLAGVMRRRQLPVCHRMVLQYANFKPIKTQLLNDLATAVLLLNVDNNQPACS